ncbi:hypothetical protein SAMN05518672_101107 [Chitinophaga sp. CF118]|uniref:hypothetical protein n=1 Tax=Chitinophaga sp. CF118 TaxID=1884367 RepID=UPI0008E7038E|nr:hypothetical protein [Chitinophaga sp. CF118]SFD02683.1 hypothetical protein SAMN05518672_101107 [Chitinophaga sp. CF118]
MIRIKKLANILLHFLHSLRKNQQVDILVLGELLSRQNKQLTNIDHLAEAEFKIFSQGGDDGIIQFLINKIDIPDKTFIEFGVERYIESNTRFLLKHDNWSGLIIDGSEKATDFIKTDDIYYQHELKVVTSFITAENINELISSQGIKGEIGLLSIDIDGVDYWIWKAINVVQPVIVVIEYNSVLGAERALTVPYKPDFIRSREHHSNLYFGASIIAMCTLGEEKGYAFVGSNSIGNNAYFVKKNRLGSLKTLTAKQGYVLSKFRESRDMKGNFTHLTGDARYDHIKGLPVYNISSDRIESL